MSNYLQLQTSLFGDAAQSTRLATRLIEALASTERANAPGRAEPVIVTRDLARDPLPHLTAERFAALATPADQRTPAQAQIAAESDALVAELQAADVIVIGLPMYNFGVPSTLKTYFDHVARAGVTFRYTAQGPEGLLRGKKAYVVATRGGKYSGTPQDLQSAYVRQFLGFVGITDVEFIYAEGLALGDESRAAALAEAGERLERLAA
ncbi:MAG TPA: NAD(P)H-dependent oxidoreductase [Steroidobacteraceae bacterium]